MYDYRDMYGGCYGEKSSYMRVLHASPDAPPVDVYLNDTLLVEGLPYKRFTEYIALVPGIYNIKVFASGTRRNPVIDTEVDVFPNSNYTVAATGLLEDIKPMVINDTAMMLPSGKAQIKFVHLSPDAPAVDVLTSDGTILFRNIEFREVSPNRMIDPNRYTLQVRPSGGNRVVLTVPNVNIRPNRYYTVYAVGEVSGEAPLQLLIALDKASY
ncbi:DUF4397 domain-containing protein [Clostridiisalibacter paucivorans]|uniref:DUF4397 domain-containing protein n=1 Tax=Clostridiisalibacter paucivorans TaxID=408753 RepID=UPI000687C10B|nr:DUF4397 domain-containing protein [Clostridiisalibacter paucivorans]